ncbi:amino acid adenylation domain-containing protein [Paracoccus caeni]|uniref:Amino acid adenylation domain-containing protein n=1 Tax=Paracoccus caeni TaxID=657651 RepID=A0A934W0P0_9RHOB|nr:non-ribosomal peptide synthetase [Paracoccus caeni]MBK4215969.1 amino acid adenylation domain-containing protein [Paracoccus caeni]
MNTANDILELFEMTPSQAGMLFQSLYAPENGAYFQQYWGRLDGALDADAFRAAWQAVIARHDILRARCHWDDLDRPAFAIHRDARPEWQAEDWAALAANEQDARLAEWLQGDRARGFDMDALPLMRFALIRLAEDRHVFVWSFHHLLLDGWCGALLVAEVMRLYGGGAQQPPAPSFGDYVTWLDRQDKTAAGDYWTRTLTGIEGPTPLGIDRAETGETDLTEHRVTLGGDLSTALQALARRERLTLATLMQGAWALVMSRYAGTGDVTFGTVLAGRPADLPGVEEMAGLFLQTVPLRVTVTDQDAPLDWLRTIQSGHPEREAHGHIGLSAIRAASGLPASTPLFDSLLIVETYPESIETAVSRGGSALRLHGTGVHERTDFPLVAKVLPGEDIILSLAGDCTRIPAEALPRLAGHLMQVLQGFILTPETLAGIELLTAPELDHLARIGQGVDLPVQPTTLAQLLAMAKAQPDRVALETAADQLTYAELMARAGQIAASLTELGIGHGDIVAVCQDRTPDLLASLIAIWRCGAAYLPLDPAYPAERVAFILEDAQAVLALADPVGAAALGSAEDMGVLMVADCRGQGALRDAADAEDLAYILYTSGSTGKPKGVPISHGALANFLGSMRDQPGIGADDRLLALTTIAFDIAGLELFGPLITGGTVVLAEAGAALDGAALARMIEHHRISVMQATPAGWRVLRDSGWQGRPGLKMISGGEALDSALATDLMRLGGTLWNLYGPTETTIWSAALLVGPQHLRGAKVPVGGPIACTTLSLRDATGRLQPLGVSGELWIGGAGLSPGYLGRDDLTADRFVTRDGARHYRTGDRMRLNADGTLDFLGRFDDQVKLRGYRIELGEIERQIETHPAIGQAVAMVRGEGGAAKLIGYLRPVAEAPTPAEMRAHLAQVLPAYMIPSAWVTLPAFPLTPNGKIDRKALPLPDAGPRVAAPAGSQRDEVVAAIWAEVLDVPHVGPQDDFFALGGQSLLAMRVIGEVRRHLGVDLSLRDLFEAPVLARFCARIAERAGSPVLPGIITGAAPTLSAAQHRQWLLSRLAPDSADYHLPLALRLTGRLDPDALRRALSDLARRHSVLRWRFPSDQGIARVDVLPDTAVDLPETDLSALPVAEREPALAALRETEATARFALEEAAPWRARLVRVGAEEHVLLLTFHHILADEWSFGVMLQDLRAAYLGEALAEPVAQYGDFAAWQRVLPLQSQREFWKGVLENAPAVTDLPSDLPRPAQRDGKARRVDLSLDAGTTQALDRLARQNGASLFICLLAAWAVFLSRHSGRDDLLVGTPVSNRRLPEFQNLVGLFVNTLAIRADLADAADFTTIIARLREAVLAAHAHQDLPFEQVIEAMSPPRSEAHAPLVQTMFSMPELARSGDLGPDLDWQAMPAQTGRARFDLSLELARNGEGLAGHLDLAADLFSEDMAARLSARLVHFLSHLADTAEARPSDLPLLRESERSLILPALASGDAPSGEPGVIGSDAAVQGVPELPVALVSGPDGLRPAPGVRALVLGREGELMPPGATGWLALGGAGLSRGYPGDPARTAVAFLPNPHVDPRRFEVSESCLFHTGLPFRLTTTGAFEAATPMPEPIRLQAAPVNTGQRPPHEPARGETEQALALIWAGVLGTEPSRADSFFDLGGDSVMAVQVAARAAEAGLAIQPRDLFRHQTIAELATVAQPLQATGTTVLPELDIDLDAIADLVSFGDE